jgi:hypothetical protein
MTDVKCGENVVINVNCGCNSAYGDLTVTHILRSRLSVARSNVRHPKARNRSKVLEEVYEMSEAC